MAGIVGGRRGSLADLGGQIRANACVPPTPRESYARWPISREQEMPLIHYVVAGKDHPAVVFVHGFGCAHSDWAAQVAHLSLRQPLSDIGTTDQTVSNTRAQSSIMVSQPGVICTTTSW